MGCIASQIRMMPKGNAFVLTFINRNPAWLPIDPFFLLHPENFSASFEAETHQDTVNRIE